MPPRKIISGISRSPLSAVQSDFVSVTIPRILDENSRTMAQMARQSPPNV